MDGGVGEEIVLLMWEGKEKIQGEERGRGVVVLDGVYI